jgi:exopolysaccharide biosynthesis polyprenyl glycosylphosphotransferase
VAASAQLAGFPAPALGWLLLGAFLNLASLLAWRRWHARCGHKEASLTERSRNVLIVGAGPDGREVAGYLERHPELGRMVRGFLDECNSGFRVLGTTADLAEVARAHFIDEIILTMSQGSEVGRATIREALRNHLDVKIVPDLCGCDPGNLWIDKLGMVPLVTLHREDLPAVRLSVKRALDVVVSLGLLLITLPGMLCIALLVLLDSPGPVFYAALRVGRKGKPFRCFKFRTMVADANRIKEELRSQNQRRGPCFKILEDPRITRVGRWLRRYSLDELPQLWNVLAGEMSMVGPRPHPLDDFARYELNHLRRLDVTPGITGLWQVMARRSPSFQTNLALDIEYIEHWSLRLDLRILLKTVAVVLQGTGA